MFYLLLTLLMLMLMVQKTAYKAVMKPTEGTILTVVRRIEAQAGLNKIKETDDLVEIMHTIYEAGEEALKRRRTYCQS